jgi:hypothetical protein
MENNKTTEFHTVEFMRTVRNELSEQFFKDKQKYLAFLKKAMEDFKIRQKQVNH